MIITFLPQNIKYHANAEDNLLSIAALAGVFIDGNCGSKGICGKCKIKVLSGDLEPIGSHELEVLTEKEIEQGYRLACKIFIESDMVVEVSTLKHATRRKTKLTYLPDDFIPEVKSKYGIAYDIGTTTVVAMLWNLKTGKLLDTVAKTNPQSVYGADVISRINFCSVKSENLSQIQKKIIDCMNELSDELFEKTKVKPDDVLELVAVGNTTMSHLLLGMNPETLARAPFEPAFTGGRTVAISKLGLLANTENLNNDKVKQEIGEDSVEDVAAGKSFAKHFGDTNLHVLPNIAGHVGSDIVAGILSSRLRERGGTNLSIDIGTNGEIALFHSGKIYVCSTAAGPAFEGASIKHGMRAASGAIEVVSIKNGEVSLDTIDGKTAVGICGSGLIDAIAQMLDAGVIDTSGKMVDAAVAEAAGLPSGIIQRLRKDGRVNEFVLAFGKGENTPTDIVITQKDVREVQLAKAAIQAGITCLLNLAGITFQEIDRVILAGAFGNYINKKSALRIGMLPPLPLEKIISVGNAAGSGASMALLSLKERERAHEIAKTAIHVELSTDPSFQDEFLNAMYF